jgi:hypothetical protein
MNELYIGALNLSPWFVSCEMNNSGEFCLGFTNGLPAEIQQDLKAVCISHDYPSVFGLPRPSRCWMRRFEVRPLNSWIHAQGKPILSRSLYADEPVYFIWGAYYDTVPF